MNILHKLQCGVISKHYGMMSQKVQTYQELAELTCILAKREDQKGADYLDKVLDEIADVMIMCEQMRQLHGFTQEDIDKKIEEKITRQMERIVAEKGVKSE